MIMGLFFCFYLITIIGTVVIFTHLTDKSMNNIQETINKLNIDNSDLINTIDKLLDNIHNILQETINKLDIINSKSFKEKENEKN